MAQHKIVVSDAGFNPSNLIGVKTGDTVLFEKASGSHVTGVRVLYWKDQSTAPTQDGIELLFGDDTLSFPTGSPSQLEPRVLAEVNRDTTYRLQLIPTPPEELQSPGRGGTFPTEKGGFVVVGGSGPSPFPDKRVRPDVVPPQPRPDTRT